jgi:1-acyl-sn-glycerol-3-phosphate acyltransferase
MLYRFLRWLLRTAMRVFFRHIEVVGLEHVPADGAVIFAGNHPNSLIDPILIITTCGRMVHFAAKDTLFSGRVMRALLRGLGAVPLARREDRAGAAVDNDAAFTAMFDVLAAGRTIGIFPEGLSHDESQLARLKTGAARLALGAHARGTRVVIVPCGLTFIHPKRFRSRVLVQYGEPIEVVAGDARELTDEIERDLRALTINATDWETIRELDAVRRLYQPVDIPIADRVELARRFNTHYPAVADDPRVVDLLTRVGAYQRRLDELGLGDRELARRLSPGDAALRVGRYLALALLWLPLMLPAAPLHLPAIALARLAGRKLTPRKDVIATTKVLFGICFVLLAYLLVDLVVFWRLGWMWGVAVAAFLPLSGYATLKVVDRFHLLRRGLGALGRRLHLEREATALRAERATLQTDTIRLVDALRPADLVPLYPPEVDRA